MKSKQLLNNKRYPTQKQNGLIVTGFLSLCKTFLGMVLVYNLYFCDREKKVLSFNFKYQLGIWI